MPKIERYITKSLNFPNKQDPNNYPLSVHIIGLAHTPSQTISILPAVSIRTLLTLPPAMCCRVTRHWMWRRDMGIIAITAAMA